MSADVIAWLEGPAGGYWRSRRHCVIARGMVGVIATVERQPGNIGASRWAEKGAMRGPVDPDFDPVGAPPVRR